MSEDKKIKVRLRLIIIKEGKLLIYYTSIEDFYFYVGGHLEHGETIEEGAKREIREELGEDVEFKMEKILYIRDFLEPNINQHSVEFFIKGDINKFEELEGKIDPEHGEKRWVTWCDINNLPDNLFPKTLTPKLQEDYKNNFPNAGVYLGECE